MSLIDLKLGGLAGLCVGTFAVAAYAGFLNQIAVEVVSLLVGVISGFSYVGIQLDRYYLER